MIPLAEHTGRSPLYHGFQECCRAILVSGSRAPNMSFAKSYAQAGLHLSTSAAIRRQAEYIVANLSGWRDPEASTVRATLRAIAKDYPEHPHLARSSGATPDKSLSSAMLKLKDREGEEE